jgi:hypothetical protein
MIMKYNYVRKHNFSEKVGLLCIYVPYMLGKFNHLPDKRVNTLCVIFGFRRGSTEFFRLLCYYAG